MKYPNEQFNKLIPAVARVVEAWGSTPKDILNNPNVWMCLYHTIFMQFTYEDGNPNVITNHLGQRLIPIDNTFKLYPDKCGDPHVETAMKAALKSLA